MPNSTVNVRSEGRVSKLKTATSRGNLEGEEVVGAADVGADDVGAIVGGVVFFGFLSYSFSLRPTAFCELDLI